MEIMINALSPLGYTLIILGCAVLLAAGFLLLIRRNFRKGREDKYTLISDYAKLNELLRLIDYRIKNKTKDIFFTLLLVSIDDFDRVGEIIGQQGADIYLEKFVQVLRKTLPVGGKMAQTAEKETFLVYLPEYYGNDGLEKVARVFKEAAETKILINSVVPIEKTASVSVTTYPSDGDNVVKLVNNLLAGLYSIKKTGGNDIALYDTAMDERNNADRYKDIKQAIDFGNMKIRFNPLIHPEKGIIAGVESMINRVNENGTTTEYGRLLTYLEETNDDFWFTIWAVEKGVLSNIDLIKSPDTKDFVVFLKAGYKFMTNPDSAYKLQASLERYGIPTGHVVLEVDNVLDNELGNRYVKNLLQMQGTGIRVAANVPKADRDLNRLIEVYDVDMVKLRAEDVLGKNDYVQALLKACYNYRKKVIVAGVESAEQAEKLKNKNISYIEGPYFGVLLTKEQINNMVNKQ